MFNPIDGPARTPVSARQELDVAEMARMQAGGTLVVDNRRRRPLYFDGRFLAARDLTREQNYFLTREADLSQASGGGVAWGLLVARGGTPTSIQIMAGHGVTPSGKLVVLQTSRSVELADATIIQSLDISFGLLRMPREPARNLSGLFIVALRPVEFTANPIASYPTSVDGTRAVSDGDIVEAAAISLIPYNADSARSELNLGRARVAHDIFAGQGMRWLPPDVLPLAMVALDRDAVQWVDSFMVRREIGAEHGSVLGLGFAPRALREAHLLQYQQHLHEVMQQRTAAGSGQRFAAADYFLALPPGGPMPAAAINPAGFTQTFFPAEVDVTLSVIPDDEVMALLEESLLLPPIDLTLTGDEQVSTSVLAVIPVPRQKFQGLVGTLTSVSRALPPAAPGLVAKRLPLQALQGLMIPRQIIPVTNPQTVVDQAWATALQGQDLLWYVRRRNLQYKSEIVGVGANVVP